MAVNAASEIMEVFDSQDCLAADRDATVQLPNRLSGYSPPGDNLGCSPLFEVMVRKLEHPNALLR